MPNSIIKLYPSEWAKKREAWINIQSKTHIELSDIATLINAEHRLFSVMNKGRTEPNLQSAWNLNTEEGKVAAIKWFLTSKLMLEIASQNMKKAAQFKKTSAKEVDPGRLELIDRIIAILNKK